MPSARAQQLDQRLQRREAMQNREQNETQGVYYALGGNSTVDLTLVLEICGILPSSLAKGSSRVAV